MLSQDLVYSSLSLSNFLLEQKNGTELSKICNNDKKLHKYLFIYRMLLAVYNSLVRDALLLYRVSHDTLDR